MLTRLVPAPCTVFFFLTFRARRPWRVSTRSNSQFCPHITCCWLLHSSCVLYNNPRRALNANLLKGWGLLRTHCTLARFYSGDINCKLIGVPEIVASITAATHTQFQHFFLKFKYLKSPSLSDICTCFQGLNIQTWIILVLTKLFVKKTYPCSHPCGTTAQLWWTSKCLIKYYNNVIKQ